MSENPCIGESLESFLRDEGIHHEVVAMAISRTLALQAAQTISPAGLSGVPGARLGHVIGASPTGASSTQMTGHPQQSVIPEPRSGIRDPFRRRT